jgi:hypothetical protein
MLKAESGPNNAGPQVGLAKLNPIEVGGFPPYVGLRSANPTCAYGEVADECGVDGPKDGGHRIFASERQYRQDHHLPE